MLRLCRRRPGQLFLRHFDNLGHHAFFGRLRIGLGLVLDAVRDDDHVVGGDLIAASVDHRAAGPSTK